MDFLHKGIAGLLILAGSVLAFLAFQQAMAVYEEPVKIEQWLQIRAKVHALPEGQEPEKRALFKVDARPTLLSDKQFYALGGYFSLFFGILVLWLMANIAITFLRGGVRILLDGRGEKKKF